MLLLLIMNEEVVLSTYRDQHWTTYHGMENTTKILTSTIFQEISRTLRMGYI